MRTSNAERLTPRKVEGMKPKATRYRVADGGAPAGGLLLEVRPSGGKSWVSRLSLPVMAPADPDAEAGASPYSDTAGAPAPREESAVLVRKVRRVDMTLGAWPVMGIEEARAQHLEAVRQAAAGHDPRSARLRVAAAPRFAEMMERWLAHLERHGKNGRLLKPASLTDHRRRWRDYLGRLDPLPLADLDRAAIAVELTRGAERSPTRARAALVTLKAALAWAVAQGWIAENPAEGMKGEAYGANASPVRDVVLSLEELRQLWAALDAARLSAAVRDALRLAVLTGARRGEVAGMRWEELDLAAGVWRLPEGRTKTSTARPVYLSPEAVETLRQHLPATGEAAGPVFRMPGRAEAITPDTLSAAVRRLQRQPGKGGRGGGPLAVLGKRKPFTAHDLRRTCATLWAEYLGAEPHLIGLALGHAQRDSVARRYQHATREGEQREMLRRWGALVADHVAADPGAAVVPFRLAGTGE
ncbi:tyrosine-type recombinase/integrase [Modicisalibacter tunisiensis]|nr:tyrosine-type recombinase/integrase [Modicisalibacter tunisiensis]